MIVLRRRMFGEDGPPLPITMWDYQNPEKNRTYEKKYRPDDDGGRGEVVLQSNDALCCRARDYSKSKTYYAAVIFGPFNLTRYKTINLIHDRGPFTFHSGTARLCVFPTLNDYVAAGGSPTATITTSIPSSAVTNQELILDISSLTGKGVVVVEVYSKTASGYGGYIDIKNLTMNP